MITVLITGIVFARFSFAQTINEEIDQRMRNGVCKVVRAEEKEDLFAVVSAGAQSYVFVKKSGVSEERIKGNRYFRRHFYCCRAGLCFCTGVANHDPAGVLPGCL